MNPLTIRRRRYRWAMLAIIVAASVAPLAAHANEDSEPFVVIQAGRVITVTGEELVGGEIVLADGKVRLVGQKLDYPKSSRVIDARREVVMPGMVLPRTRWQLSDYSRSGIHADRGAGKEVYLDRIDFGPLLEAGFTTVCFYPEGTGIAGTASIFRTAGDPAIRGLGPGYVRITLSSPARDKKVLRDAIGRAKKEIEKVEKARKEWEEKRKKAKPEATEKPEETPKGEDQPDKKEDKEEDKGESSAKPDDKEKPADPKEGDADAKEADTSDTFTPPKIDPAVLPLVQWLRAQEESPPLLFELSRASDLRHLDQVLETAPELPATALYLSGGTGSDYHQIVKDLAARKATALISPDVGNLPNTVTRYNLAADLALSDCGVVLMPSSDSTAGFEAFRSRVAEVVRAGMPRAAAFQAITLRPAELLGLDSRLGSIDKGKDADLLFLDGDPLDPLSRLTRVMTLGEIVWEATQRP